MTCKIKICGITNQDDLELIAKSGADYGGVIVEAESPRAVKLTEAWDLCADPPLPVVAVTLDRQTDELIQWAQGLRPAAMQLHGHETPAVVAALKEADIECEVWKVIHLPAAEAGQSIDIDAVLAEMQEYAEAGADRLLIDATVKIEGKTHLGGTGKTVDWQVARALRERSPKPLIVAGGINPGNAAEAVTAVRPYAIDLASGVELTKGKKDPDKVIDLITRVRAKEQHDEIC